MTWQLTTEWALPFEIKGVRFVQGGFVHFIGPEGGSHFNIVTQPQLLLDIGKFAHYVDQVLIGTGSICDTTSSASRARTRSFRKS